MPSNPEYTDEHFSYASLKSVLKLESMRTIPISTRLEIAGTNFTIFENSEQDQQTLFYAIAQALVGQQSKSLVDNIHDKTVEFILNEGWEEYRSVIEIEYASEKKSKEGTTISSVKSSRLLGKSNKVSDLPEPDIKEIYKNFTNTVGNKGSMIELCAAAEKFHFTFGVISLALPMPSSIEDEEQLEQLKKEHGENFMVLHVYNCVCPNIVSSSLGVKYYFLQSGERKEDWEWNYLEPDGQLFDIPDGVYPSFFKRIIQYPKSCLYYHAEEVMYNIPPPSKLIQRLSNDPTTPLILEYKGREFYYRRNKYDDETLFSILNHALFDSKSEMRMQIHRIISHKKERFGQLYERTLDTGNRKKSKRVEEALNLVAGRHFLHGDINDLRIAASIFKFTYEVFGVDKNMNWFHLCNDIEPTSTQSEVAMTRAGVHLVLLVLANARDLTIKWYRLQQSPTHFVNNSRKNRLYDLDDIITESMASSDDFSLSSLSSLKLSTSSTSTESYSSGSDSDLVRTKSSSSNSFAIEEICDGPKKSNCKSIPLLTISVEESKIPWIFDSMRQMIDKLISNRTKTRIVLIPKNISSQNKWTKGRKLLEVNPDTAQVLQDTIPWFSSIPKSDYYVVAMNKSRPSTMLPLVAYRTVDGNELYDFYWGKNHGSKSGSENSADHDLQSKKGVARNEAMVSKQEIRINIPGRITSGSGPPEELQEPYLHRVLQFPRNIFNSLRSTVRSTINWLFGAKVVGVAKKGT